MINAFDLVGKTILLSGYRGDGEKRVGKVVAVRDTHMDTIKGRTRGENPITRGRWLLTVKDDERDVTRSYYVAHASNVKVMGPIRKVIRKVAVATGISEPKEV